MNIKSMAGAHEVQKVLKLGLSSIQDDLAIVSDPHSRAGDKAASIKRLQHSVSTLNVAVTQQNSNFATIKGASSASYAANRIATTGKRQQRESNNAQDLSTHEQLEAWRIDQGEMVTPTRSKHHCPGNGKGDRQFKHNIIHSCDEIMQDVMDDRIQTDDLMNLDPDAGWTAADLVAIMCNIDKGKRRPIADAWAESKVIPVDGRTMMRRVEWEHAGKHDKARKFNIQFGAGQISSCSSC